MATHQLQLIITVLSDAMLDDNNEKLMDVFYQASWRSKTYQNNAGEYVCYLRNYKGEGEGEELASDVLHLPMFISRDECSMHDAVIFYENRYANFYGCNEISEAEEFEHDSEVIDDDCDCDSYNKISLDDNIDDLSDIVQIPAVIRAAQYVQNTGSDYWPHWLEEFGNPGITEDTIIENRGDLGVWLCNLGDSGAEFGIPLFQIIPFSEPAFGTNHAEEMYTYLQLDEDEKQAKSFARACKVAQKNSSDYSCVQHVYKQRGRYHIDDFYYDNTVRSYENGKQIN